MTYYSAKYLLFNFIHFQIFERSFHKGEMVTVFLEVRPMVVKIFFDEFKMDGLKAKSTIKISRVFMIWKCHQGHPHVRQQNHKWMQQFPFNHSMEIVASFYDSILMCIVILFFHFHVSFPISILRASSSIIFAQGPIHQSFNLLPFEAPDYKYTYSRNWNSKTELLILSASEK